MNREGVEVVPKIRRARDKVRVKHEVPPPASSRNPEGCMIVVKNEGRRKNEVAQKRENR